MRPGETSSERNLRLFGCTSPVALVTGSLSPRVGRVVADWLTAEGFRLILHGRHPVSDEVTPSYASKVVVGDIQDETNVHAWLKEILAATERIDVVVNSAAIWEPIPLEQTVASDFEHFFRVNALSLAIMGQVFGLQMVEQPTGGTIINIGDWAVARPYQNFPAYLTSKGVIPTLTQTLAVELASRNPNVRVNCVMPGPVLLDPSVDSEREQLIQQDCLLRRSGTAEDVAQAILYLVTAPFVTGVCLPVDGGRTIHAGASRDVIAHPSHTTGKSTGEEDGKPA